MSEFRCAVELRADDSRLGPGVLHGTLLTYGEVASDRPELFEPGSLRWPDGGIMLREQHARSQPIVRFTPTLEGNEVRIAVRLPDTSRGRDAAVGVRESVYKGLSVEFLSEAEKYDGELRRITRALLTGAGLVDDPSYSGSSVEVRQKGAYGRTWMMRVVPWLV